MPPDTMEGSDEIRDLDNFEVGYLYEGKLVTGRTFGHATYGCAGCCAYGGVGYDSMYLEPDPMSGFIGAEGSTRLGLRMCVTGRTTRSMLSNGPAASRQLPRLTIRAGHRFSAGGQP
jgi:hypothetical protein